VDRLAVRAIGAKTMQSGAEIDDEAGGVPQVLVQADQPAETDVAVAVNRMAPR